MTPMQHQLADLYLSWVNEFLTVDRFAEYYSFSVNFALAVISEGKKCHELRVHLAGEKP